MGMMTERAKYLIWNLQLFPNHGPAKLLQDRSFNQYFLLLCTAITLLWYRKPRHQVPPLAISPSIWNGQALGMDSTINELREFAREHAPSLLCIVETDLNE
jgi:hypothetical protein